MFSSEPDVLACLSGTGGDRRHPAFSGKSLDRALTTLQRPGTTTTLEALVVFPHRMLAPLANLERAPIAPRTNRPVVPVPPLAAQRRFPVASIDLSRRDVALPFGVGRYINAATLKRIAGGRRSDRFLKKTPSGWEFMENDAMVDLTDASQEYRLGRLTIFS